MEIGAVFPSTKIGADPFVIRDYAQAVEGLGYSHLAVYEHVLGADPTNRPGWQGYTHRDMFHEPFVLFGYLAALTHLELLTDVIILPQRQTVLVAKQAAEVDMLTGGKLRLGVGVGWIPVEYEALGMDYHIRGRVIEEQIEVLRLLWSQEVVSYQGHYHSITEAGLNPLPIRRSIPIWIGGWADAVLRRTARLADGWLPLEYHPDDEMREAIDRLRLYTGKLAAILLIWVSRDIWTSGCDRRKHGKRWGQHTSLLIPRPWNSSPRTSISISSVATKEPFLADLIAR